MRKLPKFNRSELIQLILFVLMLLIVISLTAWATYEIRDLRQQMTKLASVEPRNGIDVLPGKDGIIRTIVETLPSQPGPAGEDGQNATQEQVAAAVDQYFAQHPVVPIQGNEGDKGDTGEQGPPGPTVILRVNPLTNDTECLFLGDTVWLPVENCHEL